MDTVKQQQLEEQLVRLQQERGVLESRLAGVDAQLSLLHAARYNALQQRLAALEAAASGIAAPSATQVAPTTAQAVPTSTVPGPRPVAAAPTRAPRIIAQAWPHRPIALLARPDPESTPLGRVPSGGHVLVTDEVAGAFTRVVFMDRPAWVVTAELDRAVAPVAAGPSASAQVLQPPSAPSNGLAVGPRLPGPPQPPAPPRAAPSWPPVPAQTMPAVATVMVPPRPSAPPEPPLWRRPGFTSKLLALLGAAVTLIGVTFLLILAAQYGFFGPEARTLSAAGLGIVLVVLAFVVRRRDPRNVGAPILAATGVAAGFLSVVTATVIYGWLPPVFGASLAALIGLGGMLLARRWNNQWLALVAVLGGLLLGVFLGRPDPVVTATLMVALTGITLWVERGTGWQLFPFARVLPTAAVLLGLSLSPEPAARGQVVLLVVLTVALALLGLASAVIAPAEPFTGQLIALSLLVPMVGPAAIAPAQLGDTRAAAAVLGGLAVVFVGAGFVPLVHERVRWVSVPVGAGLTTLAVLTATQQRFWGVLGFVLGAAYLAVAAGTKSRANLLVGGVLAAVGLVGWLPLLASSFSQELVATVEGEQVAQSLAGIAAVVMATLAASRWVRPGPALIYLPWATAIAMGSVAIIESATLIGVAAGNPAAGFQAGQAIVTSAWMGLCVLFLHRGLTVRGEADSWLRLALTIAALAVAKLFLLDLGMLDAIARVGAFLAVGLLLLFVGTRYAKAWERAHGEERDEESRPPATVDATAQPAAPVSPAPAPAPPDSPGEMPTGRPITFTPPAQGPTTQAPGGR